MNQIAQDLKSLHRPGNPLILANIYDVNSAQTVAALPSCKALATASYAIARINGVEDDDLQLETNLAAVRDIAKVARHHQKPLTADIQDGYGSRLEEVIGQVVECGASDVNLEDRDKETHKIFSKEEATSRVAKALDTAKAKGVPDFVINARCDVFLEGGDLKEVIERGKAYLAAGATSIFVWGGSERGVTREEVVQLTEALDGRLSVKFLLDGAGLSVNELAEIGVCRMSVGPSLYRIAKDDMIEAAERLLTGQD